MTRRSRRSVQVGLGAAVAVLLVLSTTAAVQEFDPWSDAPTLALTPTIDTVETPDQPHVVTTSFPTRRPPAASARPGPLLAAVQPVTLATPAPPASPAAAPAAPADPTPTVPAAEPISAIPPEPTAPAPALQAPSREPAAAPPPVPSTEPPPPIAAASVSLAATPGAAVTVAMSPDPEPEAGVTVGDTSVVGDAPPPESTRASVGGTLVSDLPLADLPADEDSAVDDDSGISVDASDVSPEAGSTTSGDPPFLDEEVTPPAPPAAPSLPG